MPESSTIPNTVQVRLLWTISNQLGINVLHAIAPAGFVVNQTTTNTLGTAIKSAYTSNLAIRQPNTASLVRVALRDRRIPNSAEYLDTGAPVVGSEATSEPLPPQTAMCVTFRTAGSGKSYRGRVYIGGFGEAGNDGNGRIASTHQTAVLNFITAIQSAMTASGLTLAVASRGANLTRVTSAETQQDGTVTTRLLYTIKDKTAMSNQVTIIESRNTFWETQRRRSNARGAVPTIFQAGLVRVMDWDGNPAKDELNRARAASK